jgi:hypothetical protein
MATGIPEIDDAAKRAVAAAVSTYLDPIGNFADKWEGARAFKEGNNVDLGNPQAFKNACAVFFSGISPKNIKNARDAICLRVQEGNAERLGQLMRWNFKAVGKGFFANIGVGMLEAASNFLTKRLFKALGMYFQEICLLGANRRKVRICVERAQLIADAIPKLIDFGATFAPKSWKQGQVWNTIAKLKILQQSKEVRDEALKDWDKAFIKEQKDIDENFELMCPINSSNEARANLNNERNALKATRKASAERRRFAGKAASHARDALCNEISDLFEEIKQMDAEAESAAGRRAKALRAALQADDEDEVSYNDLALSPEELKARKAFDTKRGTNTDGEELTLSLRKILAEDVPSSNEDHEHAEPSTIAQQNAEAEHASTVVGNAFNTAVPQSIHAPANSSANFNAFENADPLAKSPTAAPPSQPSGINKNARRTAKKARKAARKAAASAASTVNLHGGKKRGGAKSNSVDIYDDITASVIDDYLFTMDVNGQTYITTPENMVDIIEKIDDGTVSGVSNNSIHI